MKRVVIIGTNADSKNLIKALLTKEDIVKVVVLDENNPDLTAADIPEIPKLPKVNVFRSTEFEYAPPKAKKRDRRKRQQDKYRARNYKK